MAVSSLLTERQDWEGTPSTTDYGGGQSSSVEDNILIEGSAAWSRREDNQTDHGFAATFVNLDLSAAGTHVMLWMFVTQWPVVTQVQIRISDGANDDDHDWPVANIPFTQGWIPIWVDVSRTPEVGGSANEAAIDEIGALWDIGDVGGNAKNAILDLIATGTSGLRWTGTGPGDLDDFRTFEDTNVQGVLVTRDGVDYCFARLEIGNPASSTEADFDDNGVLIVWPDQPLIASTFMGISFDLGTAASTQVLTNSVLQSSDPVTATNRPDFLCTGTSGTLDITGTALRGMRIVNLTSAVTADNCIFASCGAIDAAGASLLGASISASLVSADASALIWNDSGDPDGELDGLSVTKHATTAHHAIEFGLSSPTSITLRNCDFSGFNASNGQNDSTFHVKRTSGTVTVNIVGGSGNVSYKSDGATVNIVQNPVTLTIHAIDEDGSDVQGARVFVVAGSPGPLPDGDSVSITRSGSTATVSHTSHGLSTGDYVWIEGADQSEYNGVHQITVTGSNAYTYTVSGTPTTPATGTITSTAVIIAPSTTTDVNGEASDTRTYTSDQTIDAARSRVRLTGATAPYYQTGSIAGTIDSAAGLTVTVVLLDDE